MTIIHHDSVSATNPFDLDLEVAGMTVTVKAGTFYSEGVAYELLEDQEYIPVPGVATFGVTGRLIQDRATGAVSLYIDERFAGEMPHIPIDLVKPLHTFFWFAVEPGTVDLSGVEINVHRVLRRE